VLFFWSIIFRGLTLSPAVLLCRQRMLTGEPFSNRLSSARPGLPTTEQPSLLEASLKVMKNGGLPFSLAAYAAAA
jgi:hypothetical protein